MEKDWISKFLMGLTSWAFSMVMLGVIARASYFFLEIGWNLFWLTT